VLRKDSPSQIGMEWDQRLPKAAGIVNSRIINHLGYSPSAILFGSVQETSALTATLLALPGRDVQSWVAELNDPLCHTRIVREYFQHRAEVHDVVTEASNRRKDEEAARYNRGDMVMVYQKPGSVTKLGPRWRGPFKIDGYGGSHGRSFTLRQLSNRLIQGTFHGNHLKSCS